MSLRETAGLIVKLVEEHSGFPVQIIDDPSLNTFAAIWLARRGGVLAPILGNRLMCNEAPERGLPGRGSMRLRPPAVCSPA